jgi:hypothetical protein
MILKVKSNRVLWSELVAGLASHYEAKLLLCYGSNLKYTSKKQQQSTLLVLSWAGNKAVLISLHKNSSIINKHTILRTLYTIFICMMYKCAISLQAETVSSYLILITNTRVVHLYLSLSDVLQS